jgi:DNA-binding MarR family transcriptional regulator
MSDAGQIGLGLDEQLCFALYAASRAVTAEYRPLLAEVHLTFPQYLVMLTLWEYEPASVRDIGERLHLDSGTLSPLLKRLEALGLVERRRRSDDERSVGITLTPRGRELRTVVECMPGKVADATGLDRAALADLRDRLHAMTEHMRRS